MKLIEKRCPNCGASLSFNETDKNVCCEYCKTNFEVKHDETKKNSEEDNVDLVKVEKIGKFILGYFLLSSIVPFIIFLFIFLTALFFIFSIGSNIIG